jgi:Ca2+:H+ antiporter
MRDKMDLALGVAVGSSIQIALFAVPLAVLAGWAMGRDFSLSFDPFAVLALTLSVLHANLVVADAQSHWLMGVQLIATFVGVAVVYAFR